jgi:hypothetical protein
LYWKVCAARTVSPSSAESTLRAMTFTSSIRSLRPEPVGATAIPGSPAQLETFIAQETEK